MIRVRLVATDGDHLEATIEFEGRRLRVMDAFQGSRLTPGSEVEVELAAGLLDEGEPWESMFAGNPEGRRCLEPLDGWRYRAHGVIRQVDPVVVECGLLETEAPFRSHDGRLVGEPLAFTIERLDAWAP